jgi:Carboxypeptidase regulatory-like domain
MRLPQVWLKRLSLFKIIQTAVILLACVSTSLMFAQLSGKGAISGTVTDNTGAVITNAVVTITNDATGLSVRALTTSSGFYEATTLDAGIYTVTTEAPGFSKIVQQNVHINTADNHTYNPSLTAGATTETVTVTAEPPTLQTGNATLATTMEQDVYSALPIQMGAGSSPDQRRATDFAALMPSGFATVASHKYYGPDEDHVWISD